MRRCRYRGDGPAECFLRIERPITVLTPDREHGGDSEDPAQDQQGTDNQSGLQGNPIEDPAESRVQGMRPEFTAKTLASTAKATD